MTDKEEQELEKLVDQNVAIAKTFEQITAATLAPAAEFAAGLAALKKQIEAHHAPIKKATRDAWKVACAQEKELLAPVVEASAAVRASLARFEVARKTEELQAKKKAEEERKQLAEEMEVPEEVLPAIPDIPVVADPAGLKFRTDYDFEVVDRNEIKVEFMSIDMVKIRKIVKSLKHDAEKVVGGIKVVEKKTPVVSSAKSKSQAKRLEAQANAAPAVTAESKNKRSPW